MSTIPFDRDIMRDSISYNPSIYFEDLPTDTINSVCASIDREWLEEAFINDDNCLDLMHEIITDAFKLDSIHSDDHVFADLFKSIMARIRLYISTYYHCQLQDEFDRLYAEYLSECCDRYDYKNYDVQFAV